MGEKQAEDEKDPSGWWGHTSKLCKAVSQGKSARGVPTPSPPATSCQGHRSPSTGRHSSPAGALAQPPGVSAFSSSEVGAWNRCDAT